MEVPVMVQGIGQVVSFFWRMHIDGKQQEMAEQQHQFQLSMAQARLELLQNQKEKSLSGTSEMERNGSNVERIPAEPEQNRSKVEPKQYSKYLESVGASQDVSVGCVPCTRRHLSTISEALQRGDAVQAREEMVALLEYDLTAEKLDQTPTQERELLIKYRGEIEKLRDQLQPDIYDITLAAASVEEAKRFANEDGVFHPEAQLRIARAENAVNAVESIHFNSTNLQQLDDNEKERAREIIKDLRKTRQKLINHIATPEDVETVSAELIEFDRMLNGNASDEQVKQLAQQAGKLNEDFRSDWVKSRMKTENTHVSA